MIAMLDGVKGGVGKSAIGRFVMDYLLEQKPTLIDTDDSTPDLYKTFTEKDVVKFGGEAHKVKAYEMEGYRELFGLIAKAESEGRPTVINCGAANHRAMADFGPALSAMCAKKGFDLVVLWPIDNDIDGIGKLREFTKKVGDARIVIVKNLANANSSLAESDFKFVDGTKLGKALPSVFFPAMPDFVMKQLKAPEFHAPHELEDVLPIGDFFLAQRFLDDARGKVGEALKVAKKLDLEVLKQE